MKIGFLCTAYNCESVLNETLSPLINFCNTNNSKISVIHSIFDKYWEQSICIEKDNTIKLLNEKHSQSLIHYLHISEIPLSEIQARNLALESLIKEGCDIIWQIDLADEFYSVDDIKNILKYIEKYPSFAWYKLCLKNYIFDEKHYLEKPFCPPRIFRVKYLPFLLNRFYQDNDISYLYNGNEIANSALKNKLIPQKIAFIKHITWMSNESSKNKVKYQIERWQTCSYRWNELENKLEFNPDYIEYKKNGFPKVIEEV